MSSKLFALDIGTRSVVGVILEQHGEQFHVAQMVIKEHKERAMVDGQIHNVLYVAQLIEEIKTELEQTHGPLTKVSVAAAGRALKTEQASVTIPIKNRPIFTEEDINRLELQAVQQAQQQLLQKKDDAKTSHYYCVGYSVLYYKLDGEEIGSLLDQQGSDATIEVIATFLPRVVVESLLAALKRADLEMEALTLEPIAAINVLIPPTMRRLNVALVDIGAGTSDIAITDLGTIIAYGMVPTAGDEITEALSDHYLLDFPVAENAKRQLHSEQEKILIQDILGFDQHYAKEEVLQAITPAITSMANAIGHEILRLNNELAPKAVMLVGGGSLTPNITTALGEVLGLPANRVAVRGIDAIQNLTKDPSIPVTPELVTPIGIAIAAKKAPIQYMTVTVNEQVVRLFELKEMTIADAFLAANIRAKQLYGKPGHALSITVNKQAIFIAGEHGQPAEILLNGQPASTKTPIQMHDQITLIEGQDGREATAIVKDMVDEALIKKIMIQGQEITVHPKVMVNDKIATYDTVLKDRDAVTIQVVEIAEDVLKQTGNVALLEQLRSYVVHIDGQPLYLPAFSSELLINGKPSKTHYPVQDGDRLAFTQNTLPTVQMLADQLHLLLEDRIIVTFQNERIELVKVVKEMVVNGAVLSPSATVPNGATVKVQEIDSAPWIFQDVFRFSSWQLPTNASGGFTILRNGHAATFDAEIFGGDTLQILFASS